MAQRDDVTNLHRVPLQSLVAAGEQTVEARFVSGVQPCTAVGRVDVVETESTVTVTVWIGTPASEKNTVCVAITQLHSVRASLGSPLGDRQLIDGYALAG